MVQVRLSGIEVDKGFIDFERVQKGTLPLK
jgi:hypothetical protein